MGSVYTVAIVGRPNVGKSRLFNRLVRGRVSIVHDTPGVTRDVIVREMADGVALMDTGGLGLAGDGTDGEIAAAVEDRVMLAIAAADLILFVVDATVGIVPMDYDIADGLRKSGARVIVVANRVDGCDGTGAVDEFHALGFGTPVAASAEHGTGEAEIRALVAAEAEKIAPSIGEESGDESVKIAIIGRPNVGKSSLLNALLCEDRVIVSPIPGTTRDAVTVRIADVALTDTAGARRSSRMTTALDYFASLRARDSLAGCTVVLLVVDAADGITEFDKKLAGEAVAAGKGVVVAVNKWDIALDAWKEENLENHEGVGDFQMSFIDAVREQLRMLPSVDVVLVSAKTGDGIRRLLPAAKKLHRRMNGHLGTGELNRVLREAFARRQPPSVRGKRFRAYYAVQTGNMPFTVRLFCNGTTALTDNYRKYLLHAMERHFDLAGCPLRFELVGKENIPREAKITDTDWEA